MLVLLLAFVVGVEVYSVRVCVQRGLASQSHILVASEVIKLVASGLAVVFSGTPLSKLGTTLRSPDVVIPALLYLVQNRLKYFAMVHVQPDLYLVLSQSKLLTSAYFEWIVNGTEFTPPHVRLQVLLSLLLASSVFEEPVTNSAPTDLIGVLAAISVTSMAGVNGSLIATAVTRDGILLVNVALSIWSLAGWTVLSFGQVENQYSFSYWSVAIASAVGGVSALGGILAAQVIKQYGPTVKVMASSIASVAVSLSTNCCGESTLPRLALFASVFLVCYEYLDIAMPLASGSRVYRFSSFKRPLSAVLLVAGAALFPAYFSHDLSSNLSVERPSPRVHAPVLLEQDEVAEPCGILYTLGLHTPKIKPYAERWKLLGGRGPYVTELMRSLNSSVRTQSIPVAVVTDATTREAEQLKGILPSGVRLIRRSFHLVRQGWGDKIEALKGSPFERTIALDVDTVLCRDVSSLCSMLDSYDLAMVREPPLWTSWLESSIPSWNTFHLVHHNSGMMAIRNTSRTADLLRAWQMDHNLKGGGDQTALAHFLPRSGIRHLWLPINYNLRAHGGIGILLVHGYVFVVHSRSTCITCAEVNADPRSRLVDPHKCVQYFADSSGFLQQHSLTARRISWDTHHDVSLRQQIGRNETR